MASMSPVLRITTLSPVLTVRRVRKWLRARRWWSESIPSRAAVPTCLVARCSRAACVVPLKSEFRPLFIVEIFWLVFHGKRQTLSRRDRSQRCFACLPQLLSSSAIGTPKRASNSGQVCWTTRIVVVVGSFPRDQFSADSYASISHTVHQFCAAILPSLCADASSPVQRRCNAWAVDPHPSSTR